VPTRFFPGTDPMDETESLIEDETRRLFGLDDGYAISAQPHSATQANHAVFRALLGEDGGTVAGLSPSDGGHISHRLGVPASSEFISVPLNVEGIDYEGLEQDVRRHSPAILVAGGTSYTRSIDYGRLRELADQVGCHLHADLAHTAPFIASGLHSPAFPFVHSATIDPSKNLRGPAGGILIFREEDARKMKRAVFPVLQSAPNQCAMLAKAACISHWSEENLRPYAELMVNHARILGERLESLFGPQIYRQTETHLLLFDLSALPIDGREAEAWSRAQDGGDDDDLRLADLVGCSGLRERAATTALRSTALRAMAYCRDFSELPWLAEVGTRGSDADALGALDAVVDQSARVRRATDPEDADELHTGCAALLDLAKAADRPAARRVRAIRALRMLSDRGCVKRADIPTDLDAK